MKSVASRRFWAMYDALPVDVRAAADKQYALFRSDPTHPSLRFKPLAPGVWSARVTLGYRAVARRHGDVVNWVWIGKHAAYDRLLG